MDTETVRAVDTKLGGLSCRLTGQGEASRWARPLSLAIVRVCPTWEAAPAAVSPANRSMPLVPSGVPAISAGQCCPPNPPVDGVWTGQPDGADLNTASLQSRQSRPSPVGEMPKEGPKRTERTKESQVTRAPYPPRPRFGHKDKSPRGRQESGL